MSPEYRKQESAFVTISDQLTVFIICLVQTSALRLKHLCIVFLVLFLSCTSNPNPSTIMRSDNKVEIQGHRGARGLWPENSMEGFLRSIDLGVDVLEMDVVMTGDGQILVSHDPFFNPEICLDPDGNEIEDQNEYSIYAMNYNEIIAFDCGSKNHPRFPEQEKFKSYKPLLKDVIKKALEKDSHIRFNIEIKSQADWPGKYQPELIDDYVDAVVKELSSISFEQYNLQSFDTAILYSIAKTYPKIKLSYLVENESLSVNSASKLGIPLYAISPDRTLLNKELIKEYQSQGLTVIPWTVNEKQDMLRLIEWGVDGIITDYPNLLQDVLAEISKNGD